MKTDEYCEVLNAPETYQDIARRLRIGDAVLIGWSEGVTHYDILFTHPVPLIHGRIATGLWSQQLLFVSIMRIGAFGFETARDTDLDPEYVGEKLLNERYQNSTTIALTELINGVIKELVAR